MFTNSGTVVDLWTANEPQTNRSAIGIQTDATDVGRSPSDKPCNCVWVDSRHPVLPIVGTVVTWGPGHVWWTTRTGVTVKIEKLGVAFNRDDPLH